MGYGCSSNILAPVATPENAVKRQKPTTQTKNKGFHIVNKGDTLYSIAWRYSQDHRDLAQWNDIKAPFVIYPGQLVRLKSPSPARGTSPKTAKIESKISSVPTRVVKRNKSTPKPSTLKKITWQWPTRGNLINLDSPTSKKGVNISGKLGQSVEAAARGEVVYSGSGLLGYGKLIIIKHNETYLSAYAHNNVILKKEGMKVSKGEKIATMGVANNGKPLLHFEIRRDGKPVDPLRHLPQKRS